MGCSVLTSLTTEAIKKILDERGSKYSANILAAILSVVFAIGISIAYIVMYNITFSPQIVVYMIALVLLSFLCATLGYDKVVQTISQISKVRG